MRRLVQLFSLLTLAASSLMLVSGGAPAQAASAKTVKPTVLQTAWYWQNLYEQSNSPVTAPPPQNEPSGVPKGDLGAAYTLDPGSVSYAAQTQTAPQPSSQSTKLALIAWNLNGIPFGSTVNAFTFSVTLDNNGTNFNQTKPPLVACLPTRLWSPSEGGDYTQEPPTDCGSKAVPSIAGDVFTFKIVPIAQTWLSDQNLGVALQNDPGNTQTPFQTVFSIKSIKATMTWTPGAPVPPVTNNPPPVTTSNVPPAATGSNPPPPTDTGTTTPSLPSQTTTTTPTGTAPQVAPPANNVAAVKPASSVPTAPFWIAAALFALLMLICSLVLGDSAVPASSASRSRLDRALRERGAGVFAAPAP